MGVRVSAYRTTMPAGRRQPVAIGELRRCSIFSQLNDDLLTQLAQAATRRNVNRKAILVAQGDNFRHLGIVIAGSVDAIVISKEGRRQLVYQAGVSETFAETSAFDEAEIPWQVSAGEKGADVILVPARGLRDVCRADPTFGLRLARLATRRTRVLAKRLVDLSFESTSTRIAQVILQGLRLQDQLVDAPPQFSTLSQTRLAELAGTVRVVTARALRTFARAGAIELKRGRIARIRPRRLSAWL